MPLPLYGSCLFRITTAQSAGASTERTEDDTTTACPAQNSAHFKNEQRKQAQTEQRIARMRARAARLSPAELAGFTKCVQVSIV